MNIFQFLAICGMLSPIVYNAMWIICGSLQPKYSHIRDDVSSLFAIGAPNKRLSQSLIIISSVLLFFFFIGLHEGINDGEGSIAGPVLFLISSFLGVLVAFYFPLDAGGKMITPRGKLHLILTVISGVIAIAGMAALWFTLNSVTGWSDFATYSLISAILTFILVIIAGIFIKGNYRGILERIMVISYHQFYFILGLMVFLNN